MDTSHNKVREGLGMNRVAPVVEGKLRKMRQRSVAWSCE